jgi:hypothetical protein
MRLFTFNPNLPNPGRSSTWTVRQEAVSLANAGMSGLAGLMLRDGFSILPTAAILYTRNDDKITMAELAAEVTAGLDTRRAESGTVKPIINGTTIELFKRRLADIADRKAAGIALDGRRRCIAAIIAVGCGREDIDCQGIEATTEQAAEAAGIIPNGLHDMASRLDAWAKVQAATDALRANRLLSESELMALAKVKRGDGQLMHRAASAIVMHDLTPDYTARCPGKEEWASLLPDTKGKRPTPTASEAAAMLAAMQTSTREKAVSIQSVAKALQTVNEKATGNLREFGTILATGDGKAVSDWIAKHAN